MTITFGNGQKIRIVRTDYKSTAVHEAAHAVVCYRLGNRMPSDGVAEVHDGGGGRARVDWKNNDEDAVITLAGGMAPVMYLGRELTGCSGDFQDIIRITKGMPNAEARINEWIKQTALILKEPSVQKAIFAVSGKLEHARVLKRAEIEEIIAPWRKEWSPSEAELMRLDARIDISHSKSFRVIEAGGRVIDYADVSFTGYLSTFGNQDRDGDVVKPGAFAATISDFLVNPVLLSDHRNSCAAQVGSFTTVREDSKGLYVEASLSNAQSDLMRHVRALVAEKHLRTTSMGGLFFYESDGRTISRVTLLEGSLVSIPSNPAALISVRKANDHEKKWWKSIR